MANSPVRYLSRVSVIATVLLLIASSPRVNAQPAAAEKPATTPAGAGNLKTLAVVSGARYEKLISDVAYLGSLIGQPAAGQMVEGLFAQFTMGKGATLIDKTKAWGVIVQTDGAGFYPVACLPITKPDDVMEVAKAYNAEVKDGENGTKELLLPNGRTVFVKSQNDVVFLSMAAASLSRVPANAQELLTNMVSEYDLRVAFSVKNVPEMYKQFALQAVKAGMQNGMKRQQDETDEQFAEKQRLADTQFEQFSKMLNEIDSVKIGWGIDAQGRRTYADVTYQFLAGSKMAQRMAAYGKAQTDFAGFYQPDAAAAVAFAAKADPKLLAEDLAQFEGMMRNLRQQSDREIEKNEKIGDPAIRDALKAAANDLFDALESTIKEGHVDGGASLHVTPNSMSFIAGLHVKDPAKLQDALKKLETAAKTSPKFPGITWNAASHAGVKFHTMKLPVPNDDPDGPRKMLGETLDVAIGIGSDAVYLALGRDNMNAVTKAIDASASNKGKSIPPFELVVSLGPVMEVAADAAKGGDKDEMRAIADNLKSQAQGRDHIRATGQPVPNGLQYRIEAEEGVIKAIGTAAMMKKQRGAQGNP